MQAEGTSLSDVREQASDAFSGITVPGGGSSGLPLGPHARAAPPGSAPAALRPAAPIRAGRPRGDAADPAPAAPPASPGPGGRSRRRLAQAG